MLVGIGVGGLFFIGIVIARLYRRTSKELAFVRTGLGGEKIILDGGALCLPVFQKIVKVNMRTLRLQVDRKNEEGLITADRMRVDVTAEFYVRVKPEAEAIAKSAQTLGDRTLDPETLKELLQGKFVDALRSVAAGLSMGMMLPGLWTGGTAEADPVDPRLAESSWLADGQDTDLATWWLAANYDEEDGS